MIGRQRGGAWRVIPLLLFPPVSPQINVRIFYYVAGPLQLPKPLQPQDLR